MKKRIFMGLVALSALGLVACNNSKKAKKVELKSDIDSVSYAIGVQNADQMLTYFPMTAFTTQPKTPNMLSENR